MDALHKFFFPKLILFFLGYWSSVSAYLLPLFQHLTRFGKNVGFGGRISEDFRAFTTETSEESLKITESNKKCSFESFEFPTFEKNSGEIFETEAQFSQDSRLIRGFPPFKDQIKDGFQDKLHEEDEEEERFEDPIGEEEKTEEIGTFTEEILQKFHHENGVNGFISSGDSDEKQSDSEKGSGGKSRNTVESTAKNMNLSAEKPESSWEHQELIEQLEMEIKQAKVIGLPTIFEESESPTAEVKPWKKIEAVHHHGQLNLSQTHKLYEGYKEKMRKLDTFNYQKMHAIGFLLLKDPLRSVSRSKLSVPEATTFWQSFSAAKGKKHENRPTVESIKTLRSDLELVYVGQMCLSWEILHWQYQKVLDVLGSEPHGVHEFDEIVEDFRRFRAQIQGFVENEAFHGPRIENYVKNRCVFRDLMQVPSIREDDLKNWSTLRNEKGYDLLVEILEESIRVFWRFVCADKGTRKTHVEFRKPEDSQMFVKVQKDLRKKTRKIKEQLNRGSFILKNFERFREEDDRVLYLFCQVDLKLVERVLKMSRLTNNQLIWCQNKLNKISFLNKRIHVESSFMLFPC